MSKFKVGEKVKIIGHPEAGNPFGFIDLSGIPNQIHKISSVETLRVSGKDVVCIKLENYPWAFTEDYFEFVVPSSSEIKIVYKVDDMEFDALKDAELHLKHKRVTEFVQSKWGEPIGPGFLMKYSKELVELLKD